MPVWHSHSIGWRVRSLVSSPYNASIFIVELPTYKHAYVRYTLGYSAMWIYEWISRIASHALRERKQVRPAGRQANTIGSWVYCLHISCVFFLFFFCFTFIQNMEFVVVACLRPIRLHAYIISYAYMLGFTDFFLVSVVAFIGDALLLSLMLLLHALPLLPFERQHVHNSVWVCMCIFS